MRKLALLSSVAALVAAPAFADNTDSEKVEVTGTVVASLELTKDSNLEMPTLVASGADQGPTSVTVACDDAGAETITYSGNGSPFAAGSTTAAAAIEDGSTNAGAVGDSEGDCAEFSVEGEDGYAYTVETEITSSSDNSVANTSLTEVTCSREAGVIGDGDVFACGATVTSAAGSTATGSYTDFEFAVTITYD